MKISIAVPSFNYARFLESCLKSIKQQDYLNYEVLIADGGSTDHSLEIIKYYCETDSRFKLVSTQDSGQADSIFKAFEYASGDILCFLNADDCYLCKDALHSVVEAFTNHDSIQMVSFGGYYLDANGKWLKPIHYRYHPLDSFELMKYRTAVLQPATFWLREVYNSSEWPVDFNFVFDVVFFYKSYQKYSWLELPKPVAGYRLHGDNKSMSVKSKRIMELADFECIKFGKDSWRGLYLRVVGQLVRFCENFGGTGRIVTKAIYSVVNGFAFVTCYRFPSI